MTVSFPSVTSYFYAKTAGSSGIQGTNVSEDTKEASLRTRALPLGNESPVKYSNRCIDRSVHQAAMTKFTTSLDCADLTHVMAGINTHRDIDAKHRELARSGMVIKSSKGGKGKGKGPTPKALATKEMARLWNQQGSCQPFLRSPYNQYNKPYYVSQFVPASTLLTTSAVASTTSAAYFTVGAINQITTLTGLFDQYRVTRIEAWIQYAPMTNGVIMSNLISANFVTYVDYDDASAPSSLSVAYDSENALSSQIEEGHYHDWTPKVAIAAYNGAFTGYASVQSPWIDASSPDVQHYGIKIACDAAVVNPIRMSYRLHTLWRALR